MNNKTWDILTKELAIYGVKLINAESCEVYLNENFIKIPTNRVISSINKRIKYNGNIFETTIQETISLLSANQSFGTKEAIDKLVLNYFINSTKDLYDLSWFLTNNFTFNNKNLGKQFCQVIRSSLNKDYTEFSREVILEIPKYKISLDWIFRKMALLSYIKNLIQFARLGPTKVSQISIKTARGISGPWANLDLPMLERKYPWADIAEEMSGRENDKKKQRRYRKGFEHYNDPYGRVGEGHYWREERNAPFSWTEKNTESPYPSRKMLSG